MLGRTGALSIGLTKTRELRRDWLAAAAAEGENSERAGAADAPLECSCCSRLDPDAGTPEGDLPCLRLLASGGDCSDGEMGSSGVPVRAVPGMRGVRFCGGGVELCRGGSGVPRLSEVRLLRLDPPVGRSMLKLPEVCPW